MTRLTLAALCLAATPAVADTPKLSIELNTATLVEDSCQLTFVLSNTLAADIDGLMAETVLFSKAGAVELLTLFDFGAVPVGRPRVRQFQVAGADCAALGQVLINGIATCEIAGAASDQCAAGLSLSSRIDMALEG